jgi:methyl-accepting chemotaxis protein
MSPTEIAIIRTDFARVAQDSDRFAASFYRRLAELDPDLRSCLPPDMRPQHLIFMQALSALVAALDRLDTLTVTIRDSFWGCHGFGIDPHHYVLVGEAFLDTLEQELGQLSDTARQAWVKTYTLLADAVTDAVAEAGGPVTSQPQLVAG